MNKRSIKVSLIGKKKTTIIKSNSPNWKSQLMSMRNCTKKCYKVKTTILVKIGIRFPYR